MKCCEAIAPRRKCLEYGKSLPSSHLADDDIIWPVPERGFKQHEHVNGTVLILILDRCSSRDHRKPVVMHDVDLPCVLNGHYLLILGNKLENCIQERRFT